MKKILTVIFLLFTIPLFAQTTLPLEIEYNPSFSISNYIGVAPSKSEATFYIGATRKINNRLALGLKGGIYNYDIDLNEGFANAFNPLWYESNANVGIYDVENLQVVKQNFTYIGALTGEYFLKSNLSFEFSAGMKYYLQKTYLANIEWAVPYPNAPPPELEVIPDYDIRLDETKDIIKAYYFIGANYIIKNFKIGVFGDNVYSIGAMAGVLF